MKTKKLTFLLALTFLFLFSGSVFGGVFDKKGESVVLYCQKMGGLFAINMKDKTIKNYSFGGESYEYEGEYYYDYKAQVIFTINNENEVFIEGINETKKGFIVIYRNAINAGDIKGIRLEIGEIKEGKKKTRNSGWCVNTDKKF